MTDIRFLQTNLPWTVHYHRDFRASPMSHKDFDHALLHVMKAAGKLAALVNDAEHGGCEFKPEDTDQYVVDLVVCALRMANTCPGRVIDLDRALVERIEGKNGVRLPTSPPALPASPPENSRAALARHPVVLALMQTVRHVRAIIDSDVGAATQAVTDFERVRNLAERQLREEGILQDGERL